MKLRNILLLMILSASSLLRGQDNYFFTEFKDVESLSSSLVNDFHQDRFGFLWLATKDGLNRYDGMNVKYYKHRQGDDTSIPDNEVHQVLEDKNGDIWVGCFNSIAMLSRKTQKFTTYSLDHLQQKDFVRFFTSLLDKEGNIWFGDSQHGILKYNQSTKQFDQIKISDKGSNIIWGEVHEIIELNNGAILAADYSNGLMKYNKEKNQFEKYFLKPGFNPKAINSIFEDSNGNIWFGGASTLIKYIPSQYIVKQINLLKNSRVNSSYNFVRGIIEDDIGNIWIGLQGHGLFKISKNGIDAKPQQFVFDKTMSGSISNDSILKLYKDKYGMIWIAFRAGGINLLNPQSEPFSFTPLNIVRDNQLITTNVTQIKHSKEKKNELILGTSSEGIYSYNLISNSSTKLYPSINSKQDSIVSITGLIVDENDNIWFSQNDKWLNKLEGNKVKSLTNPHTNKTALPMLIKQINYSSDGKIWVSSNSGIDAYMPIIDSLYSLPRVLNKPIDKNLKGKLSEIINTQSPMASILKVGEGANLEEEFVVTKQQKFVIISVGEGRELGLMYDFGSLSSIDGKIIWAADSLKNSFFFGGAYKNRISIGCVDLAPGKYKLNFRSDIGHSYGNWNVLPPPDSSWWGIQAFSVSDKDFQNVDSINQKSTSNKNYIPFESAYCIEFSKKYSNNIWFGTGSHSFFRFNLSTGQYRNYNFDPQNLSSTTNVVFCIYEDLDGIVWAGTYSSLIRLDPETEKINSFTTDDGLPGGIIYSITEDNNGALWINTSGGLSKLNKNAPLNEYAFINYDSRDGLKGNVQSYAVYKDENGRLFFGGKNGIISFKPGNINLIKPDVAVFDMKINEISIFDDSSSVKLDSMILTQKEINLSYAQNDISFDFSVIHFTRAQKNKIAYKLEGYSRGWIESDRNFASFTNLDPGEYVFRVIGSNGDGVWNETGRSIDIVIHPPWWQTTFAYIIYGIIFLGIIFGVDRFQRRRLLSKAKERAKIQDAQMRAQIAEAENERKTKELEEARELQLSMLPNELPQLPNLDIAVYMQTATEVGGDYYDFHVGMDGTLTVVIGDATGHGLNAGTIVTATKSLFNSYAPNPDILFTFSEISRCIKDLKFRRLSMCLSLLKIEGNRLKMSAAGMPPALIYRDSEKQLEEIVLKGMPLGAADKFPYELSETALGSGDTILLSSDGFPELFNDRKEMFGYDRVKETFTEIADRSAEKIIDHLKNTAKDWAGGKDPDDDVTFVVLKMK